MSNEHAQRISRVALIGFAAVGLLLRIRFYLSDRAIWFDEALAALDAIEGGLERVLPPHALKIAPPGFLLVEKGLAATLGNAEWSLRVYPFLCGVLSLVLFAVVCRKALRRVEQPFAMLLFALSPELVFYGAELKPYATDVFFALLLVHVAFRNIETFTRRDLLMLTILGCVVGWFSWASSLVLAAVSLVVFVARVRADDGPRLPDFAAAAAAMALNVLVLYRISIQPWAESQWVKFWQRFHLRTDLSLEGFQANLSLVGSVIYHHFGLVDAPWTLTAFVFLVVVGLAIGCARRDHYAWVAALVLVLAIAMSLLRLNPFHERVVLYLLPFFVIGVVHAWRGLADGLSRWPHARTAALVVASLWWLWVAGLGAQRTIDEFVVGPHPIAAQGEDFRPFFTRLIEHRPRGETVHVEFTADHVFNYYAHRFDFEEPHRLMWKVKKNRVPDVARYVEVVVESGRSWFVFTGRTPRSRGIRDAYLAGFERMGVVEAVVYRNEDALVVFRKP